MERPRVSVRLDPHLLTALRHQAQAKGLSISYVLRSVIATGLAAEQRGGGGGGGVMEDPTLALLVNELQALRYAIREAAHRAWDAAGIPDFEAVDYWNGIAKQLSEQYNALYQEYQRVRGAIENQQWQLKLAGDAAAAAAAMMKLDQAASARPVPGDLARRLGI